MSATRLPTQSHGGEPERLEELEELGDDAIIAQQTAAHSPQPRAQVSEESRSVVISDPPLSNSTYPRSATFQKTTGEPTLIIRDRRALDELRQQVLHRQAAQQRRRSRAIYLWSGLAVVAFVLGGIVAFLATDSHPDSPRAGENSASPGAVPARGDAPGAAARASGPALPATAIKLDDLPVEHQKK